jgi:hypothetical protein
VLTVYLYIGSPRLELMIIKDAHTFCVSIRAYVQQTKGLAARYNPL